MKTALFALAFAGLAACDTIGLGTSISIGSDGPRVSNTVSGTTGNTTAAVRVGR